MSRIVAVGMVLLLIAGCGSNTDGQSGSDASSPLQKTSSPAPPSEEGGKGNDWVTVNNGSGCIPQIKAGGCWLPLYPRPSYMGVPLNMQAEAFSKATCLKGVQANCWPQPEERLQAVCLVQAMDRTIWLGVFVESSRILTPSDRATIVEGGAIGFAEARWFNMGEATPSDKCA